MSTASPNKDPSFENTPPPNIKSVATTRDVSLNRSVPIEPTAEERSGIKQYLQQIGQIDLLTPEQEFKLATKVAKGDKQARDLMIRANLRLVAKIAYDYANYGLPISDLISEGNIGLIKAVERFDPDRGAKLSTYAAWWIKQSIKRALANQSKSIRLPVHLTDKIAKMRRVISQLTDELEREPSDEEVSIMLGIPVNKVAHLKSVSTRPASLDAPVGEDEGTTFGDLIGDEKTRTPFEDLKSKSYTSDITDILSQLEEREAKIIRLRFGLDGDTPKTLEEVGSIFDLTRERVRQLQNLAIKRMRNLMADREVQRSAKEVLEENKKRNRMKILKDFFDEKRKEQEEA